MDMGTNVFLNRHTKQRETFSIDTEEVVHDIFQNLEALKEYLESDCDEQILIDQDYGSSYMNGIKHHMMLIDYLDCWNIDEPDVWKRYCELLEKHLCNVHPKFIDQFLADVYFQKCEHLKLIELYKKKLEEND